MSTNIILLILGVSIAFITGGLFLLVYKNKWVHILLMLGGALIYGRFIAASYWGWFEAFALGLAVSAIIYAVIISSYYIFISIKDRLSKPSIDPSIRKRRKDGIR